MLRASLGRMEMTFSSPASQASAFSTKSRFPWAFSA
jgi:hypothetical protein